MQENTRKPKRERGRPPEFAMPERIDATPEEIAKAFLRQPPKEWRYKKRFKEPTN